MGFVITKTVSVSSHPTEGGRIFLLLFFFSGLDSSSEELPVTKSDNGSIVIWFRARA